MAEMHLEVFVEEGGGPEVSEVGVVVVVSLFLLNIWRMKQKLNLKLVQLCLGLTKLFGMKKTHKFSVNYVLNKLELELQQWYNVNKRI